MDRHDALAATLGFARASWKTSRPGYGSRATRSADHLEPDREGRYARHRLTVTSGPRPEVPTSGTYSTIRSDGYLFG